MHLILNSSISLVIILSAISRCHSVNRQYKEGIPGIDYPAYSQVPPRLQFSCKDRIGYFADSESNCQVWHWCIHGGQKYSFLCPIGTLFNQEHRICDWWYNVDCAIAPNLYNINEDLYKDFDGNLI